MMTRLHPAQRVGESALAGERYACTGEPSGSVLLLHAFGSCGADWVYQIPALREHFDILTVDLPGHGRSPLPVGCARVEDMARLVACHLGDLGVGRVHVVGLSLGGVVALALTQEQPELIASLVLVNAFARLRISKRGRGLILRRVIHLLRGDMRALADTIAGGIFPAPEQRFLREAAAGRIAANPRDVYSVLLKALYRVDLRAGLREMRLPCLVVSGEADTTVAESAKRELSEKIPSARWMSIPGSGHATPLDMPETFNRILLDFLLHVPSAPHQG